MKVSAVRSDDVYSKIWKKDITLREMIISEGLLVKVWLKRHVHPQMKY